MKLNRFLLLNTKRGFFSSDGSGNYSKTSYFPKPIRLIQFEAKLTEYIRILWIEYISKIGIHRPFPLRSSLTSICLSLFYCAKKCWWGGREKIDTCLKVRVKDQWRVKTIFRVGENFFSSKIMKMMKTDSLYFSNRYIFFKEFIYVRLHTKLTRKNHLNVKISSQ